jgi:hypothetical protein
MVAIGDGAVVLFGGIRETQGFSIQTFFNDVDVLDGKSGEWVRLSTTGTAPPAPYAHVAVSWTDPTSGAWMMTIYGGLSAQGIPIHDVHTLNLATQVWSGPLSTTGTAPPFFAVNYATAVSWRDATSGAWQMTIFGGQFGLADVYSLDLTTSAWSGALTTTGTAPSMRWGHSAVSWREVVSGAWKMTVFGGQTNTGDYFADVFTFDLATNTWSGAVTTTGAAPSARSRHSAVSWREAVSGAWKMTVFGGSSSSMPLNDVYTLDLATGAWIGPVSTTGAAPHPRVSHVAAVWSDTVTAAPAMTIFSGDGGRSDGISLAGARTLDLTTRAWRTLLVSATGTPPSTRSFHSAVSWVDAASGAWMMTVFGGFDGSSSVSNDVQTLNLATGVWSGPVSTTGIAVAARRLHTAVSWHDAASAAWQMTIHGGEGVGGIYGDTRTLNLATGVWGGVSTTGGAPSPRKSHTAVSWREAASGAWKMTVFAGVNSSLVLLSDVYTIDLATGAWSGAIAATGIAPSARASHTAVSWREAASGANKMTVFGGTPGNDLLLADVHTFDLTTGVWSGAISTTGTAPSPRIKHTAVSRRDAARGKWKMTVFGGRPGRLVADMHTLDLESSVWSVIRNDGGETGTLPEARHEHSAVSWSDAGSLESRMTIFGGKTQRLGVMNDVNTATLASDGGLAISANATTRSLRGVFFTDEMAHLNTRALALRNGATRGTIHGFDGALAVTFSCATHIITAPIATPLACDVALRCATPPLPGGVSSGCCTLVCSTGVCFTVDSPARFELTGFRLRGGDAKKHAGAAVRIIGSSHTKSGGIALSLLHFSALGERALTLRSVAASVGATLTAATFDACAVADGDGGALLVEESSMLIVRNCTFHSNTALAGGGGAIAVQSSSTLALSATICSENRAQFGGCIDATGAALLAIAFASVIERNNATRDGGGLRAVFTSLILSASSFTGNTAGSDGGGLHLTGDARASVNSTAFDGNRAADGGGGAFRAIANGPTFRHCTFTSNKAATVGGLGLVSDGKAATFASCTFEANTPAGTDGKANVCSAGTASAVANDAAQCLDCAPDAVAPSSGSAHCTPCAASGMQYADTLRLQCAVRLQHARYLTLLRGPRRVPRTCSHALLPAPCLLVLSLPLCRGHRCARQGRTSRLTKRTERAALRNAPRVLRRPNCAAPGGSSSGSPTRGTTRISRRTRLMRTPRSTSASTTRAVSGTLTTRKCAVRRTRATTARSAARAIAPSTRCAAARAASRAGQRRSRCSAWSRSSLSSSPASSTSLC